jgi:hypothetical protein
LERAPALEDGEVQVKRLLCAACVAALSACSTQPNIATGSDFISPSGIATVSAADRDFLLVASAGNSDLHALNMCVTPSLPDGGAGVTTCPSQQDFTFVPGPIRLFPASFPVGNRPLRLAGLKLEDAGQRGGAVLVAGAPITPQAGLDGGVPAQPDGGSAAIYSFDSNDILAVARGLGGGVMPPPVAIPVSGPSVDVVAEDSAKPNPLAFAVTLAETGAKPELLAMRGRLDGAATRVDIAARCLLNFAATKLALVPGSVSKLYIADGTPHGVAGGIGDGAVELDVAQVLAVGAASPPAACPAGRRIPATDTVSNPPRPRPLTALALNPEVVSDIRPEANGLCAGGTPPAADGTCGTKVDYAAGVMLIGITGSRDEPVDLTDPRSGKEAGRIVILRTATGGLAPLPSFPFDAAAAPPMEPLAVNGLARDVAFLIPPPRDKCPTEFSFRPCGIIVVGLTRRAFGLAAAVTSSDGGTYFIEADRRRFFNDARAAGSNTSPGPVPTIEILPVLSPPTPSNTAGPAFAFVPDTDELDINNNIVRPRGSLTAGVTRVGNWSATYHGALPGLERVSGTMSRVVTGTGAGQVVSFHLDLPGADLDLVRGLRTSCGQPNRYCMGIDVGDMVTPLVFSAPIGGTLCAELDADNKLPPRELPIAALSNESIDLGPEAADITLPRFETIPAGCFPVPLTLEVRAGEGLPVAPGQPGRPWVVTQNTEPRGRAAFDETFVGWEPRFDYPLDPFSSDLLHPVFTDDVGVKFKITGSPPPPKSLFQFKLTSGQQQTRAFEPSAIFAGAVAVYNSPKVSNLVFSVITGANEVLLINPALLGFTGGTVAYR